MNRALLLEASYEWVPDFPRRATYRDNAYQRPVNDRPTLIDSLARAAGAGGPGYTSVYSFPRGHSHDGEIPRIDTLFIDFDIPSGLGSYDTSTGGNFDDWKSDMRSLLIRARMVADTILGNDQAEHFRVSLSGHKGLHLFVDFEALDPSLGTIEQFKNGLETYATELIGWLNDAAGGIELQEWVDVNSADLGRMVRHPNTPHHGAAHVDHTPYCVPVALEELADMTVEDYLELTREPRVVPDGARRSPSSVANEVISEHVSSASTHLDSPSHGKGYDPARVEQYREEANQNITADDIPLLVKNKPCIGAFVDRDDAYEHGHQSRVMEINTIKEIARHNVPIDAIVEFFSDIPGFREGYTRELVKDIIGRYDGGLICTNITEDSPEFCCGSDCAIYRREKDLKIE